MAKKGNGDAKDQMAKHAQIIKTIMETAKKHGIPLTVGPDPMLAQQAPKRDLIVQVRQHQGQVVIDFQQSISWCAMAPEQAMKLAASIVKQCQHITGIQASSGADMPPAEDTENEEKVDKPK